MSDRDSAGRAPRAAGVVEPPAATELQAAALKRELDALTREHADMQALMAESDFGALFLDSRLCLGRFTERAADLFGLTSSDTGRPLNDFVHGLQYDDLVKDAHRALTDGTPIHRDVRSRTGRWYDTRIRAHRAAAGGIDGVVISTRDISERKGWQARQELLLKELTHRVKNILTVVQAIAGQTMRTTTSAQEFVETFRGRLSALAGTHDLLVQSDWAGADLAELAANQVKPYQSLRDERIAIAGPSVHLPADMATPLGLVLHELSARSARNGALSVPEGRVDLSWAVTSTAETSLLSLIWRERNGPAALDSTAAGNGGTFIERAIHNAKVRSDVTPEGLQCRIDVPLPAPPHK